MLTVQDIKNQKIKGAWKGRIFDESKLKSEEIVTTIMVKENTSKSKEE